jgi:hypothetical protein
LLLEYSQLPLLPQLLLVVVVSHPLLLAAGPCLPLVLAPSGHIP